MQVMLIRHAHSDANGKGILAGRLPNNNLSSKGIEQSINLAQRLGIFPIKQIRVSPMVRCQQSIDPWVAKLPPKVKARTLVDQNLNEVDYGSWSGKKLAVLARKSLWATVQKQPSAMYFPGGEGLAHMQQRVMSSVHEALKTPGKGALVLVSHGDVIKAIVASALGMHLDNFQRIVIDPASVTLLDFTGGVPRLIFVNDTHTNVAEHVKAPKRSQNLIGGGSGK